MVGRMGEEGLRGGRYREMHGATSDEGQAVAYDTCDRIPMQKYVFPRQLSRSWRKRPAVGDQVYPVIEYDGFYADFAGISFEYEF